MDQTAFSVVKVDMEALAEMSHERVCIPEIGAGKPSIAQVQKHQYISCLVM